VTLLSGPVSLKPPASCRVVPIVSTNDLQAALTEHFPACDALIMAAAVGDFTVASRQRGKIRRSAGPVTLKLQPTADLLALCASGKRPGQIIVAFAVEAGAKAQIEAKAREKLLAKGADFIVANPPDAMAAEESEACILSAGGTVLPWGRRPKESLAEEIVRLLNC
jgi:phosphopantothenoylcysteine decarboxylase/phosphopantothenate--cysteine ligase